MAPAIESKKITKNIAVDVALESFLVGTIVVSLLISASHTARVSVYRAMLTLNDGGSMLHLCDKT